MQRVLPFIGAIACFLAEHLQPPREFGRIGRARGSTMRQRTRPTSFIAACGSGRSTSVIPAVPAAWSVTTIAFIVHLPVVGK